MFHRYPPLSPLPDAIPHLFPSNLTLRILHHYAETEDQELSISISRDGGAFKGGLVEGRLEWIRKAIEYHLRRI